MEIKPLALSCSSAVEASLRADEARRARPGCSSEVLEGWREASESWRTLAPPGSWRVDEEFAPVPGCLTMPKLLRQVSHAHTSSPPSFGSLEHSGTYIDFLCGCTLQLTVCPSSTLTQRTMYDYPRQLLFYPSMGASIPCYESPAVPFPPSLRLRVDKW